MFFYHSLIYHLFLLPKMLSIVHLCQRYFKSYSAGVIVFTVILHTEAVVNLLAVYVSTYLK